MQVGGSGKPQARDSWVDSPIHLHMENPENPQGGEGEQRTTSFQTLSQSRGEPDEAVLILKQKKHISRKKKKKKRNPASILPTGVHGTTYRW